MPTLSAACESIGNGLRAHQGLLPDPQIQFLQRESARLHAQIKLPRPWHYAELHNPWARAAACYDSWGFLELCQSSALTSAIATLLGEDLILFDSQWLPDPWQLPTSDDTTDSDAHRFPVDPSHGVTALIAFGNAAAATVRIDARTADRGRALERHKPVSLPLRGGCVLLIDHLTPYRVQPAHPAGSPTVYAARYFPASSQYLRDPAAPLHRALTERYPLLNYAKMPLWLVRGQDRADNDFVTGFSTRAGFWTSADW